MPQPTNTGGWRDAVALVAAPIPVFDGTDAYDERLRARSFTCSADTIDRIGDELDFAPIKRRRPDHVAGALAGLPSTMPRSPSAASTLQSPSNLFSTPSTVVSMPRRIASVDEGYDRQYALFRTLSAPAMTLQSAREPVTQARKEGVTPSPACYVRLLRLAEASEPEAVPWVVGNMAVDGVALPASGLHVAVSATVRLDPAWALALALDGPRTAVCTWRMLCGAFIDRSIVQMLHYPPTSGAVSTTASLLPPAVHFRDFREALGHALSMRDFDGGDDDPTCVLPRRSGGPGQREDTAATSETLEERLAAQLSHSDALAVTAIAAANLLASARNGEPPSEQSLRNLLRMFDAAIGRRTSSSPAPQPDAEEASGVGVLAAKPTLPRQADLPRRSSTSRNALEESPTTARQLLPLVLNRVLRLHCQQRGGEHQSAHRTTTDAAARLGLVRLAREQGVTLELSTFEALFGACRAEGDVRGVAYLVVLLQTPPDELFSTEAQPDGQPQQAWHTTLQEAIEMVASTPAFRDAVSKATGLTPARAMLNLIMRRREEADAPPPPIPLLLRIVSMAGVGGGGDAEVLVEILRDAWLPRLPATAAALRRTLSTLVDLWSSRLGSVDLTPTNKEPAPSSCPEADALEPADVALAAALLGDGASAPFAARSAAMVLAMTDTPAVSPLAHLITDAEGKGKAKPYVLVLTAEAWAELVVQPAHAAAIAKQMQTYAAGPSGGYVVLGTESMLLAAETSVFANGTDDRRSQRAETLRLAAGWHSRYPAWFVQPPLSVAARVVAAPRRPASAGATTTQADDGDSSSPWRWAAAWARLVEPRASARTVVLVGVAEAPTALSGLKAVGVQPAMLVKDFVDRLLPKKQ